jgi:hypothetical protein
MNHDQNAASRHESRGSVPPLEFSRELRDDVLAGDITLSVRLWQRPRVKQGGRYRVGLGEIEVDAIVPGIERPSGASGGWPAPSGQRLCLVGHPTGLIQGASQQHFDVGVEAAELVGGPAGQRVVHSRIQSKRYLLALAAHV